MSPYNKLYIWVEGPEDKDIFEKMLPLLLRKYVKVHIRERGRDCEEKTNTIISAVIQKGDDNLLVVDSDFDNNVCISKKKIAIKAKFPSLKERDILLVVKEIEGWYLAGLSDQACRRIGISPIPNTDGVGKNQLQRFIPKKYRGKADFMEEILKNFDSDVARLKNSSFNYFFKNFLQC